MPVAPIRSVGNGVTTGGGQNSEPATGGVPPVGGVARLLPGRVAVAATSPGNGMQAGGVGVPGVQATNGSQPAAARSVRVTMRVYCSAMQYPLFDKAQGKHADAILQMERIPTRNSGVCVY